jgi:hypothetical protein
VDAKIEKLKNRLIHRKEVLKKQKLGPNSKKCSIQATENLVANIGIGSN